MKPLLTLFSLLAILSITPLAHSQEHYSHQSSKGKTYFLYEKEVPLKNSDRIQKLYFFSKSPHNEKGTPLEKVPEGKIVSETKNGLLVLKNQPAARKPPSN